MILFECWIVWIYTEGISEREGYVGMILAKEVNCLSVISVLIKIILVIGFAIVLGLARTNYTDQVKFLQDKTDASCFDP